MENRDRSFMSAQILLVYLFVGGGAGAGAATTTTATQSIRSSIFFSSLRHFGGISRNSPFVNYFY